MEIVGKSYQMTQMVGVVRVVEVSSLVVLPKVATAGKVF